MDDDVMEEPLVLNFLFFEIEHELLAIEDFRSIIENQLPLIADAERNFLFDDLADEADEAVREGMISWAEAFYENDLPRLFRSQTLVTLWAIYESGAYEIAMHLREKGAHKLRPRNFYGDKLTKLRLFFEHVLRFSLTTDPMVDAKMDLLLRLRNAIAHANGRREAVKPEDWKFFEALEREGIGVSVTLNKLAVSSDFVKDMVTVISKSLNDLMERAKSA